MSIVRRGAAALQAGGSAAVALLAAARALPEVLLHGQQVLRRADELLASLATAQGQGEQPVAASEILRRSLRLLSDVELLVSRAAHVVELAEDHLPRLLEELRENVLPALAGLAETEHDVTVVRAAVESLVQRVDVVGAELAGLPGVARLARRRLPRPELP